MATPADILLENSTLQSGTPWEHLNAQEGGGGETIIISGAVTVDVQDVATEVTVESVVEVSAELVDQATVTPEKTAAVKVNGITTDVGVCK